MGIIREIDEYAQTVLVEYDEQRRVTYTYPQMEEVELAYAITIHKSQGKRISCCDYAAFGRTETPV